MRFALRDRQRYFPLTFFMIVTTHWDRNIDLLPKRFDQKML